MSFTRLFSKKHYTSISSEIEQIFTEIVRNTYPLTWDENHISFTLMEKLETFFNQKKIHFPGWSKIVDWKSFKNKLPQETSYGDIAILVNIQFSDGAILKGVACLEAKRSFPSNNFDSINLTQINTILSSVPYSQLLLYTHYDPQIPMKFPNTSTWNSHMWVTPLNTAKELLPQISINNQRILRVSFPLTMFLMSRIFWGHDLDFRTNVYDDIKVGRDKVFNPAFLSVVNVYYDGQKPIETRLSDRWEKM